MKRYSLFEKETYKKRISSDKYTSFFSQTQGIKYFHWLEKTCKTKLIGTDNNTLRGRVGCQI